MMYMGIDDLKKMKTVDQVRVYLANGERLGKVPTKKDTEAWLRSNMPKESYFQKAIIEAIKKQYPESFVRKISLGAYSEGGLPDIMAIVGGHYFGFEVKRPIIGKPSKLQEATIKAIQHAGGTAAVVCWPEEALKIIERGQVPELGVIHAIGDALDEAMKNMH